MKKYFKLFLASAIVASSIAGCSKSESPVVEPEGDNVIKVSFRAVSTNPETKSVFGELTEGAYPTLWTTNTKVKIQVNSSNTVEAPVVPSEDQKTASFDAEMTIPTASEYTFTAISPATAFYGTTSRVKIPAEQAPIEGSVDEAAHIMAAQSETYSGSVPDNVTLPFSHIVAYGIFTLKDFPEKEHIRSIEIVADETVNLTGVFSFDYSTKALTPYTELSNTITVDPSELTSRTFWVALNPVNMEGKTLTFNIMTDSGLYVKTFTYGEGKGNFRAGHARTLTLNMSGIEPEEIVYTKVTDFSELTEGSEVIIAQQSTRNYAISVNYKNSKMDAAEVVKSSDYMTITNPGEDVQLFELTPGNFENTLMFKGLNGSYKGRFLSAQSASSQNLQMFPSNFSQYTNGYSSFHVQLSPYPLIYLNSSLNSTYPALGYWDSPLFEMLKKSSITSTSSLSCVAIYKRRGTGEGGTQLIRAYPEFRLVQGYCIVSGLYYLNRATLPKAGGVYTLTYDIDNPWEGGYVQSVINVNGGGSNPTGISLVHNVEEKQVVVTVPENTTGSEVNGYFIIHYSYKEDGSWKDAKIEVKIKQTATEK